MSYVVPSEGSYMRVVTIFYICSYIVLGFVRRKTGQHFLLLQSMVINRMEEKRSLPGLKKLQEGKSIYDNFIKSEQESLLPNE